MQAAEALTRLIEVADHRVKVIQDAFSEQTGELPDVATELDDLLTAIAVSQAMLNSIIPVARYRISVEVSYPAKRPDGKGIKIEYTVCALTIDEIVASLIGLSRETADVSVHLWEQRKTGADMISGYQGKCKVARYRSWLMSLAALETMPDIN